MNLYESIKKHSDFDVEGLADRIDILMSDMDPYEHMDVYGSYNPTEESYQDTLDSLYNNPQSVLDSISSYDIIDWEDDIQTEYNEVIQDLKKWISISRSKNESEDSSNTIEIDTQMTNHDKQLDEYGNSGYIGHSKSVRASEAEEEEKYPATECDRLLGIRSGATKDVLVPCEWHHTGSYYNETNYYDIRLLMALKDNDAEIISEYDQDEIDKAKKQWEELKSWRKPEVESETFKANVEWLTWSGTRKHPKATRHYVSNVDVTKRGSYYYFKDEDGYDTKKMIGSNGTNVTRVNESVLNEMKLSQIKQKSKKNESEQESDENPKYKVEIRDLHLTNHGYHNNSDIAWGRIKLVPKDGSGIDDPLCGLWDVIYFRESDSLFCFKIGYPVKAVANALYDYNTDEGNYTVRINGEDIPVDDLWEKINRDCTKLSVDAEGAIEGAIERAIRDDSIDKVDYQ